MLLDTLLVRRGFDSLTQLLTAYRGRARVHASSRLAFLSFHAQDLKQIQGVRLMMENRRLALRLSDEPSREPVNSEQSAYIRQVIREKMRSVEIVICMIGNGTAWRDWVEWEVQTAYDLHKGVCGIRLKGSHGRIPPILRETGAKVAQWSLPAITAVIELAAARRS